MHVGDMRVGAVPSLAVVGAGIPIAAGLGLAFKRRGHGQVAVCFFGEGASNEGTFHEGINLAAIWDLPVVFVCENNLYGASTRVDKVMRVADVADRAPAYGLPGAVVDGNDVVAVHAAAAVAVARARAGDGPTLLECKTYRHGGHSRSDPGNYRAAEEVAYWRARDPIASHRARLSVHGLANAAALDAIDARVEAEVIDLCSLAPLDEGAVLRSLAKTGHLLLVDEDHRICGWTAEVAALAAERAFHHLRAPVMRVTAADAPTPFAPALERLWVPDAGRIFEAALELVVR